MALLSPSTMALLPIETMPIRLHYGNDKPEETPVFHYRGGLSTLMEALRLDQHNPVISQYWKPQGYRWAGCENNESLGDMLSTAHNETAFRAFEAEKAKVETAYSKDRLTLSPVGGAFSIARVMLGHPVSAYRRPKTKLPTKTLEFSLSVSCSVNHARVSASMAKIVNAAHHYHVAGGPVKLTVHYLLGFSRPNPETHARGIVTSLDIPLADGALAAFSASIQFFRCILIPLAQALSGQHGDSLTVLNISRPGLVGIHGRTDDASATLEALKIKA